MEKTVNKRKLGFWAIYAIVFAVLAMAIIGALTYLWKYLAAYEQSRPMRVAQSAVEALAAGEDMSDVFSVTLSEFEAQSQGKGVFATLTDGKEVDVAEKAGASTDEAPVFSVRADGREIFTVKLVKAGRNDFFQCWAVEKIEPSESQKLSLTVVENAILTVNGVVADEKYVVERNIPLEGYADIENGAPRCVRYELPILYFEPTVELSAPNCTPKAEKTKRGWTVSYTAKGGEAEKNIAIAAAKEYVAFASDEQAPIDKLDKYLISGSVLRDRMLSFDRKYFARHDSAEMENVTASEYCLYGENACSVKVTYDYRMITDGKEYVDPSAMIMYLIKTEGGWKLAEVATLSE